MSFLFNPTQPEMKRYSHYYEEAKPPAFLRQEIYLFYQFRVQNTSIVHLPVIPDGCIDVLFCFHPHNPFAVVATSPVERCTYDFMADCDYFCVRFYPEQTSLRFQCSMKEINAYKQISFFDIIRCHPSILEELAQLKTLNERIHRFAFFLQSQTQSGNYDLNLTSYCLEKIYTSHGILNMKELSSLTGYSDRYIRKKFEHYIGFSPKEFSQIVRLQKSVESLLANNSAINEKTVDNFGFYDKSHFYKDFKKYMHITPIQYKGICSLT